METAPSLRGEGREGGLQPYIRAIRARSRLVLAVTLGVLALATLLVLQRDPTYEASAKLLVKPLPADAPTLLDLNVVRDTGDPTRTSQTAAALVDTHPTARRAAKSLKGGWTANSVLGATDVQVEGESNVLQVVARADKPLTAAALANAFAVGALEQRRMGLSRQVNFGIADAERQLRRSDLSRDASNAITARLSTLESLRGGDPTIVLAERAFRPAAATGLSGWLILALSGIAGFVLAVGAALLLEIVDPRARDKHDVRTSFPAPLLGTVPALSRRDRQRLASSPLELPPQVRESYRTLLVQLGQSPSHNPVVMFASASAGDGKTTAALQLALVLAEQGHRVLLVDLDLRRSELTHRLNLTSNAPRASALEDPERLWKVVVESLERPDLRVLPAPRGLGAASAEALLGRTPALLSEAQALADYVIVDTPAMGEVSDALRIAPHADHVVMVARPGNTNKRQLETAHELLERTGLMARGVLMVGYGRAARRSYYSPEFGSAAVATPRTRPRVLAGAAVSEGGEPADRDDEAQAGLNARLAGSAKRQPEARRSTRSQR